VVIVCFWIDGHLLAGPAQTATSSRLAKRQALSAFRILFDPSFLFPMKNTRWIVTATLAFISVSTSLASGQAQKVAYYVATTGNDSNPGTVVQPLATVAGAENKLAANYLNNCRAQTEPIIVQFRKGTWYDQNIKLTHSGCSKSVPIVYENFPGETPVFSGGTRITNWVNVSGSLWQATLPPNTVDFESLYYNGQRRLRARLGSTKAGVLGQYYRIAGPVTGYYDRFYYNPKDPITTNWSNYAPAAGNPCGQTPGPVALQGEIQVLDFELWDVSHQRISCIDTTKHIIFLTGSTTSGYSHGYIAAHRYMIENIKDEFTTPGQWYLDRSVPGAWVLHYLANPGEHPSSDTVVIPQQAQVLTGDNLQDRSFVGLSFSHDNYVVPPQGYAGSEVEALLPSAVECMDCSNLTFDTDTFTSTTAYALGLPTDNKGTSTGNVIQNSAFYDLGGGGIMMGRIASGGETDTNVQQSGVFPGAGAVSLLIGHDMLFTHNDLTDAYNQGIMVCFPDTTLMCAGALNSHGSYNITAAYNHIWNLGLGILNDFGGVYYATYGATGNVITGNKIHDFSDASAIGDSDGYGANGIYLDRGGPIAVSNNLVYRVGHGVSITTGPTKPGQLVAINNNILAYNRLSVIGVFSCPKKGYSQFSFDTNIVYQDRTPRSNPVSTIQQGNNYLGRPVGLVQDFLSNDYWNTTESFATDRSAFSDENTLCQNKVVYDFARWQALGEDKGSLSIDPGFSNPKYPVDNYTFISGPPAIGFVPFNTTGTCATCPGRDLPILMPPLVPESFPTAPFAPTAY
jgi:hypothetical protein